MSNFNVRWFCSLRLGEMFMKKKKSDRRLKHKKIVNKTLIAIVVYAHLQPSQPKKKVDYTLIAIVLYAQLQPSQPVCEVSVLLTFGYTSQL